MKTKLSYVSEQLCDFTVFAICVSVAGQRDHSSRHDHDLHLLRLFRHVQRPELPVTGNRHTPTPVRHVKDFLTCSSSQPGFVLMKLYQSH